MNLHFGHPNAFSVPGQKCADCVNPIFTYLWPSEVVNTSAPTFWAATRAAHFCRWDCSTEAVEDLVDHRIFKYQRL